MKKTVLSLMLFLCALLLSARAQNPSWQAYLLPDGSICVTDKSSGGQPVSAITLGRGETRFIEVVGTPDFSFRTSGFYVAHVDADGMLIAGDAGKAKLQVFYTATDYVELQVTVNKAPTSIKLNQKTLELQPDSEFSLSYTLSKGSAGQVTFYSANEDVVTVDEKGLLKAVYPGSAQVFAETYNGKSAKVDVTVIMPPPASIEVASNFTGYAFESFDIPAHLSGGFRETMTFTSANPAICTVSNDGHVDCFSEGTALVRISASGGAVTDVAVTVKPAAKAVYPSASRFYVYAGGTAEPDAATDGGSGAYRIESLDPSIARADDDNRIHAFSNGQARLCFTAPGGAYADAVLVVYPFPDDCILHLPDAPLAIGESWQIRLNSALGPFLPLIFDTSDSQIASITKDGCLRAVSAGTAVITANFGGVALSQTVTAVPYASEIFFDRDTLEMGVGDTIRISARYKDGGGRIRYESLDPAFALVSDSGLVTAVSPGSARIRASIANGAQALMTVYVYPAAVNIYPDAQEAVIGQGDYVDLHCSFDSGTRAILHWFSENENLLMADDTGRITSVGGIGESYAVATASSGARARIRIRVLPAPEEMTLNAQPLTQDVLFTDYISIRKGDDWDLEVRFSDLSHAHFTCSCPDEGIAGVTEDGLITALSAGTARVTVRSYNGLIREVLVEVID